MRDRIGTRSLNLTPTITMKADDFVLELDLWRPDTEAHRGWIELFLDSLSLIDNDHDSVVEQLCSALRADDANGVRQQIITLKGPGYWRDDSPLGRKVRVLNAIATSFEEATERPDQWVYGLVTAAELVARDGRDDELIQLIVSRGLD